MNFYYKARGFVNSEMCASQESFTHQDCTFSVGLSEDGITFVQFFLGRHMSCRAEIKLQHEVAYQLWKDLSIYYADFRPAARGAGEDKDS